MKYMRAYRIEHCPRFTFEEADLRLSENLIVQSALWSAARYLLVGKAGLSVELRLTSSAEDRSLTAALLLLDARGNAGPIEARTLESLLPEEYGWVALAPDDRSVREPRKPRGARWHVARLVRRSEFFDLPTAFPWLMGGSSAPRPASGDLLPVSERDSSPWPELDLLGAALGATQRSIPITGVSMREQLATQPLCLPLLGEMVERSPDRRRLFLEMQLGAPLALSITLHPVEPDALNDDRQTATFLRRCLEPYQSAVANAGFSRIESLRSVYDRYWLPPSHLCNVTIRAAALDPDRAVAVAHHMAARLGGMRAFEIYPPTRGLDTLDRLADPSDVLPMLEELIKDREYRLRPLRERLEASSVVFDDVYADFLFRMPHLYTLDESERWLRLPFAGEEGLPGMATRPIPPFSSASVGFLPEQAPPPEGRVRIGLSRFSPVLGREPGSEDTSTAQAEEVARHWHSIPVEDLTKHALIVGSTGSGKTITTRFLLRELARLSVPFLIIEPVKTEYFDALKHEIPELRRWNFEGSTSGGLPSEYFLFDPLQLQPGVSVARHVSHLKSCFQAAFPMSEIMTLVLENGLHAYYTRDPKNGGCGMTIFSRGGPASVRPDSSSLSIYPSFFDFSRFFLEIYLKETFSPEDAPAGTLAQMTWEWTQMFRRRFENLAQGPLGTSFKLATIKRAHSLKFDAFSRLLFKPTVVELDAITDTEQKSLVMAMLLTFLFERRQADDLLRREGSAAASERRPKHVLLIEEAHRLLSNRAGMGRARGETSGDDAQARAVSLFVDMLAEIRAFGQGLIVVEQIPTKIVPEAVKNTNLKIMLRLTAEDDRTYLGEAMNFNDRQKQFVTNLRTGEFVVFEENVDHPLLLTLPAPDTWAPLNLPPSPNKTAKA